MVMPPGSAPVAVITGAASGIGASCVSLLGRRGWSTVGLDLRPSTADEVAVVDVGDRGGVIDAIAQAVNRFGRIDLLVAAAGVYEEGIAVADITRQQWDRMLAVILGGTCNAIAAVLPIMLHQNEGSIIAISSELALGGSAMDLHYVAAKGAVLGVVKSLAVEVASTNIRVNAVAPGPTDTPLLRPDSVWRQEHYLATLPLGRLATPEEIACTVYYVATEGSMYCGEVLSPNSGAVI